MRTTSKTFEDIYDILNANQLTLQQMLSIRKTFNKVSVFL